MADQTAHTIITADNLTTGTKVLDDSTPWAQATEIERLDGDRIMITWRLSDGSTDVADYEPAAEFWLLDTQAGAR